MHSSRMSTCHSLPYGGLPDRPQETLLGQKHPPPFGQKHPPGQTPLDRDLLPPPDRGPAPGQRPLLCGQTDTCENITLPQTSFAGGNKKLNKQECNPVGCVPLTRSSYPIVSDKEGLPNPIPWMQTSPRCRPPPTYPLSREQNDTQVHYLASNFVCGW